MHQCTNKEIECFAMEMMINKKDSNESLLQATVNNICNRALEHIKKSSELNYYIPNAILGLSIVLYLNISLILAYLILSGEICSASKRFSNVLNDNLAMTILKFAMS